jgi:hypothetical protein
MTLPPREAETLVEIQAQLHALAWPTRDPGVNRWRNSAVLLQAYFKSGLTLRPAHDRDDEAGRKETQRTIESLAERKLLLIVRGSRDKFRRVRVTEAGDLLANALCGLPNRSAGESTVLELRRFAEMGCVYSFLGRNWIPETLLAGVEWGDPAGHDEFPIVSALALPAITRGWVLANSSSKFHLWYSLTRKSPRDVTGNDETGLPPASAELMERYRREVAVAGFRLDEKLDDATHRDLGAIPMPVGIGVKAPDMAGTTEATNGSN